MPTWQARLDAAWSRRAPLHTDPATNAYRLLNGAADGFHGFTVDRYAHVLVANLYGDQHAGTAEPVLRALAARAGAATAYAKQRPRQARVLDEAARQAHAPPEPLFGPVVEEVEVVENGLRVLVRPSEGLSTGLFLDMRETRAWLRAQAAGRTVLNCFAYTCAFGVAALLGGAARVVNLDVSRRYLDWGKRNYQRNGLDPAGTDFIFGDVFDWLQRFARQGQTFDLVLLDPPSFATTRRTRFAVEQDYHRLAALAAPVVAPGGRLVACANAHALSERAFLAQLRRGLAGLPFRIARVRHEPALDFPVAPREQPYLKVCVINKEDHAS
jgi:23S rRNA (cytosine1962-C5)-methyltransferase